MTKNLYTCQGKGGKYELVAVARAAGVLADDLDGFDHDTALLIYRDVESGRVFLRYPSDFEARMVPYGKWNLGEEPKAEEKTIHPTPSYFSRKCLVCGGDHGGLPCPNTQPKCIGAVKGQQPSVSTEPDPRYVSNLQKELARRVDELCELKECNDRQARTISQLRDELARAKSTGGFVDIGHVYQFNRSSPAVCPLAATIDPHALQALGTKDRHTSCRIYVMARDYKE